MAVESYVRRQERERAAQTVRTALERYALDPKALKEWLQGAIDTNTVEEGARI